MEDHLLSSADVAHLLGVSPSSVKRWADVGLLACAKTPGRHRRFTREAVERFMGSQQELVLGAAELEAGAPAAVPDPRVAAWIGLLAGGAEPLAIDAQLHAERGRLGSWWGVADFLGEVLVAMGLRWRGGQMSVLEEHAISEALARALSRAGEHLAPRGDGPRCLLVLAEGEEHDLGLRLVELVLREAGWRVTWAGARTPRAEIERALEARAVDVLAVSASEAFGDAASLDHQCRRLEEACRRSGVRLLVGGRGPWPAKLVHGERHGSFGALAAMAARS